MSPIPDVVVVGGGVIGCAVAHELARRAVRVLLLDKSLPGRATSASAGGLWPVGEAVGLGCGVIYHAARANGQAADAAGPAPLPAAFRDFLVASNARFPSLAGELHELTGLDVEYAPGAGLLFLIGDERERAFAEGVRRSLPPGARLELLSGAEVARLEPRLTRDLLGAALLAGEHQVNPMLLAEALKRAAVGRGAEFRPDTRVTGLRRRGERVVGVEVGDASVPCGTVVNAAGAWAARLAATAGVGLPVVPVRGQVVLTETLPPLLNACLSSATCYLAQKAHGEVLIGSTTEHAGFDVSVTPEAVGALCRGAVRAVPLLRRVSVKRAWAGLRPGTPDELPILGPVAGLDGYVNAAGGFRTGIVAAPLTGQVVAEVVCGVAPAVALGPFALERFRQRAGSPKPAGSTVGSKWRHEEENE
jgi:glycine/D-amino acid oxidase-like deaminating enzyme